jgi:hypothetical protein
MDRSMPGMTPADYHVAGSIRLNEAATAAYSRALAYWKSFRKKFNSLPASDTGTTLTRDEWLLPLFDCLGYGRLQTKRAISIDSKDYPISHGWEDHVPIHLLSARLPLDKRTQNVSGAATRSPYSLVQELLNRSSKHRWGFVSNGLKLYVLRDNASLTRSANVEFDLETMMDGEYHADFTALFLTCHQSRLEIQPTPIVDSKGSGKKPSKPAKATKTKRTIEDDEADDDSLLELEGDEEAIEIEEPTHLGPENCWLEAWTKLVSEQGIAAKEKLRFGVQSAIQTFGSGFYTCASNAALHQRLRSGELATQDYYRQLLRLVYRLLMLMVAEDKRTESGHNLLHPIDTPAHIRERYANFYGIARIRKLANERRGTPHRDLYEGVKTTFFQLREGYAPLGIPGIGSFLFSYTATPDLDSAQITNEALLDAFRNLCFTEDTTGRGGSVRRVVDFGNLGSEELGSIYESLLELHPEIDSQDGPFVLRTAAGNERKTSGSYYTPTSLINCLLDSALDPVVNHAIDVPDREEAKRRLLNLKICDPACGSGHFLIAAANRMALHLARLETQDTEPTTLQIQHAKRQIIGRCIYGVDIKEMAVELCKVSLWMETLEPGKPLSFLENHIKCGNSLLGATPRLLKKGIPDEAFSPIEGDDRTTCSQLKRQNRDERIDINRGQMNFFEPFFKLGNIADSFVKLSAANDESIEAIADKQKRYEELIKGTPYLNARFLADTWCATFVWRKDDTDLGRLCPTERKFREIERNPHSASLIIREEVKRLADQYQFHHWHLVFPDVFVVPENSSGDLENAGWSGGFDVVLGNPPWETLEFKEKEFFSKAAPIVANEKNSSRRKQLILELRLTDSKLFSKYTAASRIAEGEKHLIRCSGRFPLAAVGKINTFSIFLELQNDIRQCDGYLGSIVPSGLASDDTTKVLFQHFVTASTLRSLFDFENKLKLFPDIAPVIKFCLVTVGKTLHNSRHVAADFVFFAYCVEDTKDKNRRFQLSRLDFQLLNPNTLTCPIFRSGVDAEMNKFIYKKVPVLNAEIDKSDDRWQTGYAQGLFNMSSDSGLFRTKLELESEGFTLNGSEFRSADKVFLPLYEAKLFHQFSHRYGTFDGIHERDLLKTKAATIECTPTRLADACFRILPRYWVADTDVHSANTWNARWHLAFRGMTNVMTNSRNAIFAIIPCVGIGHSAPILRTLDSASGCSFLGHHNSLIFDYLLRQKLGGGNITLFLLRQLPMLPPSTFEQQIHFLGESLGTWNTHHVLELAYTAWDLFDFALDCRYDGPPFYWDEDRRFQIRCELDATYFHLYLGSRSEWGMANAIDSSEVVNETLREMLPTPRAAVCYIMDTFPIVRRKDEAKYGEYRTKRVILEVYDQMTEIIEANDAIRAANLGKSEEELRPLLRSYQSPLNPPPGPPTDANGNFIPYADWTDEIHRQYAGVIHPPRAETARNSD